MTCERPVDGLLVTFDQTSRTLPAHNVPLAAIEEQGKALGLPVVAVPLPPRCPNNVYVARVGEALAGVSDVVFGDVHLADIRAWREAFLSGHGVRSHFPLWAREPDELSHAIIASGIRAVVCAVDDARLGGAFVGRPYDDRLLADLPHGIDLCGENGEFHTFVVDAPNFRGPIAFAV